MTIGKSSRKSSVRSSIRAPKFLDKSSGFYGRLDEPEVTGEEEEMREKEVEVKRNGVEERVMKDISVTDQREDTDGFHFSEGMMEDDGETLLQRNTSRRSSRWRRSSRRKQKEGREEEDAARDEWPSMGSESSSDPQVTEVKIELENKMDEEKENDSRWKEAAIVHFPTREDADDRVLIRDKKRGRDEEGEEERRIKREQEEGMKMVKRNSVKNYRKALDRAFRRGWEAFITNLYSVTLTPVTSSSRQSSSPASKKKEQHSSVLAEFR